MKSATSLLLGAALATAFFLLYTSINDSPLPPPRPRWRPEMEETTKAAVKEEQTKQEEVVQDEQRSDVGEGKGKKLPDHHIVMPASQQQDKSQNLTELLQRAATADRTVLITAINEAWAVPGSFLDLFIESFGHGERVKHLVQHLLIVAMDKKAFERCRTVHPFCYWFRVDGMDFASEQSYMKGDYLEMMWRRNRFQQTILELGYTFLFTDVDILWFRNPFPHLSSSAQLVMSSDFFVGDTNSVGNYPNGGLLFARACNSTVGFYKYWQSSRKRFPGKHEQYVFDKVIKEGLPPHLDTRIQFLDTNYFGGFCQHGKDLSKICTMHANCCIGLENKLFDLKNVLEDWKTYKERVAMGNMEYFSWRVPGRCIH